MPSSPGDSDGLLSRMVKFVRSSAAGWHETDLVDHDPESGYSRQMLKEMIERKRRNDFVRKREFDMLRKLRRNEVVPASELTARPSFFQSSMPSRPDDRASTLKKIDEIEAQMSQQWWKAKGTGGPATTTTVAMGLSSSSETLPAELFIQETLPPALSALATTLPGTLSPPATVPAPIPLSLLPEGDAPSTSFSASKQAAVDVGEVEHDPELEEAAIRFAHGDDAGAEAALLAMLKPTHLRVNDDAAWLALFDLYRACGVQDRYDGYAIEFANRFGRSAPQWRQLAPQPGPAAPSGGMAGSGGSGAMPHWRSPARLDAQALAVLQATLARQPQPWRLAWDALDHIESQAVESLHRLFSQWCEQPLTLEFTGADRLEHVLAQAAPSGNRQVEPAWWRLRMEALRLLDRPDDFELVALDYCVTYEVSPPSWESPQVRCRTPLGEKGGASGITLPTSDWSDTRATQTDAALSQAVAELSGTLAGDITQALRRLDDRIDAMASVTGLTISCERLVRIDFAAAGALLNWVAQQGQQGRMVQFTSVHRLVASFFGVMGLGALARITLRHD